MPRKKSKTPKSISAKTRASDELLGRELEADRAVAESRLSAARVEQEQAQNAVIVARGEYERATFARDQAKRKHAELFDHLRSRKDTPQPLWERLTDLGEELRSAEALIGSAYDKCLRRETELKTAAGGVAFAEMKLGQATKQAAQVAEELQYAKPA